MGARVQAVGGYVLAGGKSLRMGRDKALLVLEGEPLVARCLRKLHEVCAEVAIAGGAEELARFGRVVTDAAPGCGPLGGIVAALAESRFEWNVFVPVDVPFVPVLCLNELIAAAMDSGEAVMARVDGKLQPLCGVYPKTMLLALQRELAEGRWKVAQAVAAAGPVRMVDFADAEWFRNVNTLEEFVAAQGNVDTAMG
ncbi:molybdenum cofactor guanylyltransferase [Edaphobacter sp.]|uniref:molybdenum cofactor guanylyltransferase n=1 Tax=Edaphobacter sp. TaxID=1934404 RepID=UPI002DBFE1B9|nr:molybdenum cofactor guanylyltransferase [Edaphobacter sp.]HEU5341609.1 molybdenum cofactor guanylyltransferase [Edaphobacter sp.]